MLPVVKAQLIEVVVPGVAGGNNAGVIAFPDQPYLRYKRIYGIEVYNVNDMAKSPTGNDVIDLATFEKSYLNLYTTDPDNITGVGIWQQEIPFASLHRIQNANVDPFVRDGWEMVGQVVSWEKCQIQLASPIANTTNVSFLILVYFREPNS